MTVHRALPLLLLVACSGAPAVREPPTPWTARTFAFARHPEAATLALPDSSRPDGARAEASTPFAAPFRRKNTVRGVTVWATPLPVRTSTLTTRGGGARSFGSYAPPGMSVEGPPGRMRFQRGAEGANTWGFDHENLLIGLPEGEPAPKPGDWRLVSAIAAERENGLNLGASGLSPERFAFRTLTEDQISHTGLLLPAPASATWTVDVPEHAAIAFRATVLDPEVPTARHSDGASVIVERVDGDEVTELGRVHVAPGSWEDVRLDVSAAAGPGRTLRLRSDPGDDATLDYVFLEDPTLFPTGTRGRRVIMVFVDTLRADHLGMYGYERETSPKLDDWAKGAMRFDQARSVAPWTLPSARALLSGAQPEAWADTSTLTERLGEAGFVSYALVANAYLSHPFDLHRGFTRYTYRHLRPAESTIDEALEVLEANADRDLLLMVHFMEAHLPYQEPKEYRKLFAGPKPDGLTAVARNELIRLRPDDPRLPDIRQHVMDRYDQNIRVVDDQVARLIEAAGDDATVILFADHGEEFWDHDGYEHGHAFWDEIVRVPLVIADPSMPAGASAAPASLTDVTPTVLDLLGLEATAGSGLSLLPAARGDRSAHEARPQVIGRPLYGADGWGVIADHHKWWSRDGEERLFDLVSDPGEHTDRAGEGLSTSWPEAAARSLGRPMHRVWRLETHAQKSSVPVVYEISHPEGVAAAWSSYDPKGSFEDISPQIVDGHMVLVQPPGAVAPPLIFVQPVGDALDTAGLTLTVRTGDDEETATAELERADASAERQVVVKVGPARRKVTVDLAWAPPPSEGDVRAYHPDVADQLRELGYLDEEEPEADEEQAP